MKGPSHTHLLAALVLALYGLSANAQQASPQVIATTGDFFSSSGGSLSWTLGEAVSETVQSGSILTQGFQQPQPAAVTGLDDPGANFSFYPNPVSDQLTMEFGAQPEGTYTIELFNLEGQKVISDQVQVGATRQTRTLILKNFAAALYLMRVHTTQSKTDFSYRIVKIE